MSQKKVDQYKKEKANRQAIMKRERLQARIGVTAAALVLAALIGWFGVSVYKNVQATAPSNAETITIDTSDVQNYMSEVNASVAE
ncbi:MAG: hypothetical protein Q4B85_03280 [Lachnospiraceae bacterium]|nr:hypothetical protein [Lachnospiraceae bacterium]